MSTRNLEHLLAPRSVAVIGASDRAGSLGAVAIRNVLAGGFAGPVWPVNLRQREVAGQPAWARLRDLPRTPDLALLCTPPATVPRLIAELGSRGGKAAVVLTAGLEAQVDRRGRSLTERMLEAARPHCLRVLGPDSAGLLVPGIGLNASVAHAPARPGRLAFVSQSGALVAAVLDWARAREIGFSHLVSLGERADIDVSDLVDFLGSVATTRAILLHLESIKTPRKFLSAARAAARNKPVIVFKSGRTPQAARAAAGADEVFDAACARAGLLRVHNLLDLFVAAESLARAPQPAGERLLIVTNSGGAGVLAADAAVLGGVRLAQLAPPTLRHFEALLGPTAACDNPVDLGDDASPERHAEALRVATQCEDADAVLLIHAPSAGVTAEAVAAACIPPAQASSRPLLSCWLGAQAVEQARVAFAAAGIPGYQTPEEAVRAFVHGLTYRRNQEQLIQAPASSGQDEFTPQVDRARAVLREALSAGTETLDEADGARLLAAYGIEAVDTREAGSVKAALAAAEAIGYPVALKIRSPELTRRAEVGGVALDIDCADGLRAAAAAMLRQVRRRAPHAEVVGFTVQAMARRPRARELMVGIATDAQFGPVLLFGEGGAAGHPLPDRAVALPPLNEALAKELISRTRVARLLAGPDQRPPADAAAIQRVLVRLSQMVIDLPELAALEIDPLLADERGVLALDARAHLQKATVAGAERLAIRPYPCELEETFVWQGRPILLRPIRPDDEARHRAFLERLDPEDIRMRIFAVRRSIERSELARLTQIDYEREMAFIAVAAGTDGEPETLGAVRTVTAGDNVEAEFGIVVRSDLKGRGLGRLLLDKMIRYCRSRGTQTLAGDVLAHNSGMLALCHRLGFESAPAEEPGRLRLRLRLRPPAEC